MRTVLFLVAALCLPLHAQEAPPAAPVAAKAAGTFKVVLDPGVQDKPYTGRIYLALNKDTTREPRLSMGNWYTKHPVFAIEAKDIPVGGSLTFDSSALAYPVPLADVEPGEYAAQAVARRNPDSPYPGFGAGDLYSDPVIVSIKPGDPAVVELTLSRVVAEPPFKETDRIKEVSFVSPLLSQFYGREIKARAAVILPKSYTDDPAKVYPTVYFIGGYGTTHHFAHRLVERLPSSADEVMVVVPDPSGPLGHTVFADSANNGPRGRCLVEEIMPAVQARFHAAATPHLRWVTGISSGGWASLWLTISYPDTFGMCWSFCPDPVDFRDFQKINLYADNANMYKDESGSRRPLSHNGQEVTIWYEDFCRQERVMGAGGQIHAFEAVFGDKGEDGRPRPLFDRQTGAVDPGVARSWEKFDIRLVLERQWATLGPKVDGKIHIYAGELDNFYLEGSTRLLAKSLKDLGSQIDVHIVPRMGHDIPPVPWKVLYQLLRDRAAGGTNLPTLPAK